MSFLPFLNIVLLNFDYEAMREKLKFEGNNITNFQTRILLKRRILLQISDIIIQKWFNSVQLDQLVVVDHGVGLCFQKHTILQVEEMGD